MMDNTAKKNFENISFYLLLAYSLLTLLPKIKLPSAGFDTEWQFSMGQIVAEKFTLGTDIIYNYGPLANIFTELYHPDLDYLLILGRCFLCMTVSFLFINLYREHSKLVAFLSLISFSVINSFLCYTDYSDFAWFSIAYLSVFIIFLNRNNLFFDKELIVLGFSILFAMIALIKVSYLLMVLPCIFFISLLFFLDGKYFKIFLFFTGFVISSTSFWHLSGQDLQDISPWLKSLVYVTVGYRDSFSVNGHFFDALQIIVQILLCLFVIFFWQKNRLEKILFCLVTCFFFYVFGKAVIVDFNDSQLSTLYFSIFFVSLLLVYFINNEKLKICFIVFSFIFISPSLLNFFYYDMINTHKNPFVDIYKSISYRENGKILSLYKESILKIQEKYKLPKLSGTSDLYSWNQAAILASDNTWNPRPAFQSHMAYNSHLMQMNNNHLLTDNAPDNIFFYIQPADFRHPNLADGLSWLTILQKYEYVDTVSDFSTLKRIYGKKDNELKTLNQKTITLEPGEEFFLPENNNIFFAKIRLSKTKLGSLASFLYKTSEVWINVKLRNDSNFSLKMPPSMTETGFIISPLVLDNENFKLLITDKNKIETWVRNFRISFNPLFWEEKIHIDIIEYQ